MKKALKIVSWVAGIVAIVYAVCNLFGIILKLPIFYGTYAFGAIGFGKLMSDSEMVFVAVIIYSLASLVYMVVASRRFIGIAKPKAGKKTVGMAGCISALVFGLIFIIFSFMGMNAFEEDVYNVASTIWLVIFILLVLAYAFVMVAQILIKKEEPAEVAAPAANVTANAEAATEVKSDETKNG